MTEPPCRVIAPTVTAQAVFARGWCPVRVRRGSKEPLDKGWQDRRFTEDEIPRVFVNCNVGVLLGEASGGLVDADFDQREATIIAAALLPATASYGRPGNPRSHYLFVSPGAKSHSFKASMIGSLVEIRSTGMQSLLPGSVQRSGEPYEWVTDVEPSKIAAIDLERLVSLIAVGGLVAHFWVTEGTRHDLALALSGVLLKSGVPLETARTVLQAVIEAAGDEEVEDRLACLDSAAARLQAGQTVAGWNRLKELLGPQAVTLLKRWLRVVPSEPGASGLPVVTVNDRQLREVTADVRAALETANDPPCDFLFGDLYVELHYGADGRPQLREINDRALRSRLTRAADFVRRLKDGSAQAIFPPGDVVGDLIGARQLPYPPLRALVELPILRADGSVSTTAGYDLQTRRYYAPSRDAAQVPDVPDSPTADELQRAHALISEELLGDFPFVDEASRANALALILTPMLALLIGEPAFVPLYLVDATQQGSGKTWLVHLVSVLATGRPAPMMALPDTDDELRKQITSALVEGAQLMAYDNVERRIDSEHLARALTSPVWKDRLLGVNKTVEVPINALWVATGNNLALGGDLGRRCVLIRLDPKTSRPWRDRSFRHQDLLGWAVQNRGKLVWSLLVMVRSWIAAGRPTGHVATLAGFDGWAQTAGGILAHVGVRGFLGNLEELYAQTDEEAAQWESFLLAWQSELSERSVTTAELHRTISGSATFTEALPEKLALKFDGSDRSFNIALGSALARRVGRRFGSDQLYLERSFDGHSKIARWRVRTS